MKLEVQMRALIIALAIFVCINYSSGQQASCVQNMTSGQLICPITARSYVNFLGTDFKEITISPLSIKKNQAINFGIFAGITACLFFIDPAVDNYARTLQSHNHGIQPVSGVITKFGATYSFYTVGVLGLYGYLFNDKKMKAATLLVSQSMILSSVFTRLGKVITSRERPSVSFEQDSYKRGGKWHGLFDYIDVCSDGKGLPGAGYDAFPSGHTSLAFSIATVYAKVYNDNNVVPVIAYSAASLVGISRLTEHAHWLSDVFVGAALGYFCGNQVVKTYRNSYITGVKRHSGCLLAYDLDYSEGKFFAGINLKF